MATSIGTAIIGAGYWGTNLARVFLNTDGIHLHVICDTQAERLSALQTQYPSVNVTSSWKRILNDPRTEAVVLATPPATHFPLARLALAAGKHVWVEKPLALHYRDGCELVSLAHAAGRMLFVDETFLYDPLLQQGQALLASGQLGTIQHLAFARTSMGRIRRDSNVWWNAAPHDLAILRYILDVPVIRIAVHGYASVQPQVEDVVTATLEMENGCSVHLYLNWLFPEKRAALTMIGETGMLQYEGRFGQRFLARYKYQLGQISTKGRHDPVQANLIPIDSQALIETFTDETSEPLAIACTAFRDSLLTGQPSPSSGEHSLRTLAVLEAGAQSLARGGEWVEVHEG
ncbi:MAG: Gfo/Idh/MocA family protein [Candidatus Binatia bacterium]